MKFGLQVLIASLAVVVLSSVAGATKIPLGPVKMENGNWYELVPDIVDYNTALAAAASRTHNGLQGHLVTITSEAENTFVARKLGSFLGAWIAASDSASEGNFRWTAGPESGQLTWTGGFGGSAVGYGNFTGVEPNDADGLEDVIEIAYFSGAWNDQNPSDLNCYVVEYEVVPEPAAGALAMISLAGLAWARRKRS